MLKLPRILIFVIIAVIVAGAGFSGVIWYLSRPEASDDEEEVVEPVVLYDAGEYVTNLADPNSRRFISVHIKLEVNGDGAVAELEQKSIAVRDRVLGVLRSYTYAEVSGNQGMNIVGKDIINALNRLLTQGRIVDIYFSEFIVQ